MLGRKRFNNKPFDLYIAKRNRKFFTDRLNYVKKTRDILISYQNRISQLVNPIKSRNALYQAIINLGTVNQVFANTMGRINLCLNSIYRGMNLDENMKEIGIHEGALANELAKSYDNLVKQWKIFLTEEEKYDHRRQNFSNSLFASEYLYNHIRRFCYVSCNSLFINRFSVLRLEMLEKYYDDMSEEMRNDENAFLKKQVEWLGRTFEDIEIISDEHPLTDKEQADALSDVEDKLRKWLHKEMNGKAREAFLIDAKDSITLLLGDINTDEAKRHRERIYHKELSGECLEYIVNVFNLPFTLNGKRGHKVLEDRVDPNLTPTGDSDLRELGTEG